jgi:hypothetical protein
MGRLPVRMFTQHKLRKAHKPHKPAVHVRRRRTRHHHLLIQGSAKAEMSLR